MYTPFYAGQDVHNGFAQAGAVSSRPNNGYFNSYAPAVQNPARPQMITQSGFLPPRTEYGRLFESWSDWERGAGLRTNFSNVYTNWRTKRTTKKADKWGGRAQKWTSKSAERGLGPGSTYLPAGSNVDPVTGQPYPQQSAAGAITPGMAIGAVVMFGVLIGGVLFLTRDKE